MWKSKTSESNEAASADRVGAERKPDNVMSRSSESDGYGGSTSAARPMSSAAGSRSVLGSSLQIKGDISGNEDLQLDCSVDGTIRLLGRKLTVGATAKIVANVVAGEVVVLGNIRGDVSASDRIEIKKDGSVVGELATSRIMIEDGAYFKGTIAIDRKNSTLGKEILEADAKEEPKPVLHLSSGTPTLYLAATSKERSAGPEAKL